VLMIAINHNYFNLNIDYFIPSSKQSNSFLDNLKAYILIFKKLYTTNKVIQNFIYNVESFLFLSGADTVDKIDEIIMKLEDFSEFTQELLEKDKDFNKWYNYPLRYMLDKIDSSTMSLQAMMGSQQALMMHKNKNTH